MIGMIAQLERKDSEVISDPSKSHARHRGFPEGLTNKSCDEGSHSHLLSASQEGMYPRNTSCFIYINITSQVEQSVTKIKEKASDCLKQP